MKFANLLVEAEWQRLHPEARAVGVELDRFLVTELQVDEAFITSVERTRDDQRRIYTPIALDLLRRLSTGAPMSPKDKATAQDIRAIGTTLKACLPDTELARIWAESKVSWHCRRAAFDVRSKSYQPAVVRLAERWISVRCPSPMWEVRTDNHGTGPHWHIGRRDFEWLKRLQSQAKGVV